MKFQKFAVAAALSLSAFSAFAGTSVFDLDTGTAKFKSDAFSAAGVFDQTITFSELDAGQYLIDGDISGTKLVFSVNGVSLDGHPFDLVATNGKLRTGTLIEYTGHEPLELHVHGTVDSGTFKLNGVTKQNYSAANFSGSITVSAVPEPETYGMVLAGLGLVGLFARRRKAA